MASLINAAPARKATKADAKYTPSGTEAEHCGICRHFEEPHACERVAGEVVNYGWCRFFVRAR